MGCFLFHSCFMNENIIFVINFASYYLAFLSRGGFHLHWEKKGGGKGVGVIYGLK